MDRMLINATQPEEIRVATIRDNILYDLDIDHINYQKKKSNIYKAKITRIEPSLAAVFVDYGAKKQGFLPYKEIAPEYYAGNNANINTKDLDLSHYLHEGQELLVQVDKIERGTKGAALSTYISLAGCYLILMPNNPQSGGISRRIEGTEREEMKDALAQLDCPQNFGIILRTAGLGKNLESLQWDLDMLMNQWKVIQEAFAAKPSPSLIYQDSDIVIRSIRDNLRKNIEEIIIDNHEVYIKTKNYVQQILPDFINNLKLYQDNIPLFTRFNVEKQIETAHQREIILPSKGSIVIDKTEALIAIDINSARSTKGTNIEETALNTNLEAASEIARQLRIRDIGGLIVIDFIDMGPIRNQKTVENHLKEALKTDRARIQIGKISKFGILEMSRQRLRPSLSEHNQISCPRCHGTGSIRSVESLSLTMFRLIEENALIANTARIEAQLPIEIATFVLNEKRNSLAEIEKKLQVEILIIPNKYLKTPDYKIENFSLDKLENSNRKNATETKTSYKLVDTPELEMTPYRMTTEKYNFEPAIKNVIPAPIKKKSRLLKKILSFFMSNNKPNNKKPYYKQKSMPRNRYNNRYRKK